MLCYYGRHEGIYNDLLLAALCLLDLSAAFDTVDHDLQYLIETWLQSITDAATDQRLYHLNTCVKAKVKHSEHLL